MDVLAYLVLLMLLGGKSFVRIFADPLRSFGCCVFLRELALAVCARG